MRPCACYCVTTGTAHTIFFMGKQKLDVKDIHGIAFPSEVVKSMALNIVNRHYKHDTRELKLQYIQAVLQHPHQYVEHPVLGQLALRIAPPAETVFDQWYDLRPTPKPYAIFGQQYIESSARHQMDVAMSLPVVQYGALMPDAHHGYGLPIGGVIAAEQAVIPFAVGMDIGCRMALSIIDMPASRVLHDAHRLKQVLQANTHFGNEGGLEFRQEHAILEHEDFYAIPMLRRLHGKAAKQLGSSGSGNHFVEFGTVSLTANNTLGLPPGEYMAILSHSGSRSLGASIAEQFTREAIARCRLPAEARMLAWLDLREEAGHMYWRAMNLAGEYARACHDQIHHHLIRALGAEVLLKVENHHNFAWRETLADGKEYIIHRKGATPAAENVLGIIPGSMTSPAYIVRGRGLADSLYSAAHGAGRRMSRQKARETTSMGELRKYLKARQVTLVGGSPEEAPQAYKDIEQVMHSQSRLVSVEGSFMPRVVRMHKD